MDTKGEEGGGIDWQIGTDPYTPLRLLFNRYIVFNSLRPHGLQQAAFPSLSSTTSWSLLKVMSIVAVIPFYYLILCRLLLLLYSISPASFPSFFLSFDTIDTTYKIGNYREATV